LSGAKSSKATRNARPCTILTGAGPGGAIVKKAGGTVLVQDPESRVSVDAGPRAVATGVADFVLALRELAARIVDVLAHSEREECR